MTQERETQRRLLTLGRPDAVTIEEYGPMGKQEPPQLVRTLQVSDAGVVERLLRMLIDLQAGEARGGWTSCDLDDGSRYDLTFLYANGARQFAKVERTGCHRVHVDGRTVGRATPGLYHYLSWLLNASDRRAGR